MEDLNQMETDFVHLARLALSDKTDDVRLFLARLARKYRKISPKLAEELDLQLKSMPSSAPRTLRYNSAQKTKNTDHLPRDHESSLSLLKTFKQKENIAHPFLSAPMKASLNQLIEEHKNIELLSSLDLNPTRSAIFVGPPGVGKTMTAHWLATKLKLPLFVLDLTAVMSSLLGKSGSNLRKAIDFAKSTPCVLLLDEIDAIAKHRDDYSDVGELKRLVTIMLQEVEEWSSESLLLATTNYPKLIDPALWRRFDMVVNFPRPDETSIKHAIKRFLGSDYKLFSDWIDILKIIFESYSFSQIEKELNRFRRSLALGFESPESLISKLVERSSQELSLDVRIKTSILLSKRTKISQRSIAKITRVSRDTIRKNLADKSKKELEH